MTLRILKDVHFHNWAIDVGLGDDLLSYAAHEIEAGLVDARLGGYLFKKRIAATGRGKRGGFRTIIGYRQRDRLIFVYGFAKNEKDNITSREKDALNKLCEIYMSANDYALAAMIRAEKLLEVFVNEPHT